MCLNLNENILGRKNQQSKTLVKKRGGGGVMFGFQGEHGLNGVKPWVKHHILKHPK